MYKQSEVESWELLPCPFCGEKLRLVKNGYGFYWYTHNDADCYVYASIKNEDDVKKWNKRSEQKRVEELEREIKDYGITIEVYCNRIKELEEKLMAACDKRDQDEWPEYWWPQEKEKK